MLGKKWADNYKLKKARILINTKNHKIPTVLETIKILTRAQKSTQENINISLINISDIFSDTELVKINNYKQELRSTNQIKTEN